MAAPSGVSHTRVLAGLVLGAAAGSAVNYLVSQGVLPRAGVEWVLKYLARPAGQIFLNLLFLPIIPLVFASLAVGVTRLGGTASVGRVGAKTLAYFLVTTACAAAIGLTLVNAVRPGERMSVETRDEMKRKAAAEHTAAKPPDFSPKSLIDDIIPKNPLQAFADKKMLGVIFTAILVGIALTQIDPARARLLTDFLEGVNAVTDFIIRVAMRLAPYAVFALLFATTAEFGADVLVALAAFVGTVLTGLAVHLCVVLPVLVRVFGGMNPVEFFRKIKVTMVTAFSTSSSSATLPTAIQNAEDDLGVPPQVSRFVLPLSASMNHNGTALFEAVTALFLCQVYGRPMGLEDQLLLLVLCVLTATGMAGVPGGSLPLIGLILTQFGVPEGAILIVLGVDRILDMCRTMVNVTADMTTAVFVARSERGREEGPEAGLPAGKD
ncbi:MAG: dicarboxylate/amino acid:cation symporter [Gemmataceae bacterium]